MLDPLRVMILWFFVFVIVFIESLFMLTGKKRFRKLRMMPKEPVDVWLRWAAAFAAQGLEKWMDEFQVARDPQSTAEKGGKQAFLHFHERGKYFGAQLLASAALQLWTDYEDYEGSSPMLWDIWSQESSISDGLVVKNELFLEAITNGLSLPFGAPQVYMSNEVEKRFGKTSSLGYDAYKGLLEEFISELPVRSCFVEQMRKYDVHMWEWLTILLHLGRCALAADNGRFDLGKPHRAVLSSFPVSHVCQQESTKPNPQWKVLEEGSEKTEGIEAAKVLRAQVGFVETMSRVPPTKSQKSNQDSVPISIIPILTKALSEVSENNRLVSKAGQLIDVWLSLVSGDQIWFLVKNLNENWINMCLGQVGCSQKGSGGLPNSYFQQVHRELEKRRLERRIAHSGGHRYGYMDQYATFMGYRMESVRTVLGRWIASQTDRSVEELLEAAGSRMRNANRIEVQLTESIRYLWQDVNSSQLLRRKGVQCRLIWELQNELETIVLSEKYWNGTEEEMENVSLATMMLMLLSFPGLRVEVSQGDPIVQKTGHWCAIDMTFPCGCVPDNHGFKQKEKAEKTDESIKKSASNYPSVIIKLVCGPQEVSLEADLNSSMKCSLRLVASEFDGFEWTRWRDAFLGRLEGFEEWQANMGISPVVVTRGNINSERVDSQEMEEPKNKFKEVSTAFGSILRIWSEWPPFRPHFCRFELESKDLLKQPVTVGHKDIDDNMTNATEISHLLIREILPMSYSDADEKVLRDSCVLVQNSMMNFNAAEQSDSEEIDHHQKLISYQANALHLEKPESLVECVKLLCERGSEDSLFDAIMLLNSYMGTMFVSASLNLKAGREAEIEEVILPECERLIRRCYGSERELASLLQILDTCFAINPVNHYEHATRLMQMMVSFCTNVDSQLSLLKGMAVDLYYMERWKSVHNDLDNSASEETSNIRYSLPEGTSRENYRTCLFVLETVVNRGIKIMCEKSCGTMTNNRNRLRGILESVCCFLTKGHSKKKSDIVRDNDTTLVRAWSSASTNLASLLSAELEGVPVPGVPADIQRSKNLLETAIREANDVRAMLQLAQVLYQDSNPDLRRVVKLCERVMQEEKAYKADKAAAMSHLAFILAGGGVGVPKDEQRAMALFRCSIDNGNVDAMVGLGNWLQVGSEGVPADPREAMQLYELAIREGDYVYALNGLAMLLERGAEGIEANPQRAVKLYERAISKGLSAALFNLADMLEDGAEGVAQDTERAAELYRLYIKRENDPNVMYRLAQLLQSGAEGMVRNQQEAVTLLEKAVEGGSCAAMYNLANLLEKGVDGVQKDVPRAVQLYEFCIERENDSNAMNSLALILEIGAAGVAANCPRAVDLYERAIQQGLGVSMYNLAILLEDGAEDVPKDVKRAITLYEQYVDQKDDADAMNRLALLLASGAEGIAANARRAATFYERAMAKGLGVAKYNLACLLENGAEGVPRDVNRAVRLYETCINDHKSVRAMHRLAVMLQTGATGGSAERLRAVELHERAITEGCLPESMLALAYLLEHGEGEIEADPPRALALCERAVREHAFVPAMVFLGNLLRKGADGVQIDLERATALRQRAFREGTVQSK
eukprot:TRINITY_DN35771_c0_g1_i1.p1 TRINITY_DN35771_c0_g1~~TRINITY_DN35771_c0_g1_i1.p1  ORF type:complete len:1831 (-),score=243.65 TRINITY_DN35771_c0_g1_i1:266-5041(-)